MPKISQCKYSRGDSHISKVNVMIPNKIDNLTSRIELLIIGVNNNYLSINQAEKVQWLLKDILGSHFLLTMFPNYR